MGAVRGRLRRRRRARRAAVVLRPDRLLRRELPGPGRARGAGVRGALAGAGRGGPTAVPRAGDAGRDARRLAYYAVARGFDYYSADGVRAALRRWSTARFEARVGHRFGTTIAGSLPGRAARPPDLGAGLRRAFEALAGYDPLGAPGGALRGRRRRGAPRRLPPRPRTRSASRRSSARCTSGTSATACCAASTSSTAPARAIPSRRRASTATTRAPTAGSASPGSDHHGDAKIHSSLAHHYDRPRVWIESFHTSGWGGTLEETFDWLLPWLGAGANLYNPHASYYSTRARLVGVGAAVDRLAPALLAALRRVLARRRPAVLVLTWGTHACDVGVLLPAATARSALR